MKNAHRVSVRSAALVIASAVTLAASSGGCNLSPLEQAAAGCSGLNTSQSDVAVQSWVDALNALATATQQTEAHWLKACNEINGALHLDTTQTTASAACAVLGNYISNEKSALTIDVVPAPPVCQADLQVQGSCEAKCAAAASCDVATACDPGKIVVGCNGSCSGECDVKAPTVACSGECEGQCTLSAAAACSGTCSGTCSGACVGTCDGKSSTGSCAGQCLGNCSGTCSGTCTVEAGAACNGTCNGTCVTMGGTASCTGECHGTCSVETTPPSCTGTLSCMANAQCQADCQAEATASLDCAPPQLTISVNGDDALLAAYVQYAADLGVALQQTAALEPLVSAVASASGSTEQAFGTLTIEGESCLASEAQVANSVSVSVQVSVTCSTTVEGQG